MTYKRCKKVVVGLICTYLLYVIITAVVLFGFHSTESQAMPDQAVEAFPNGLESNDRVALIEGREDAAITRIDLLETATETLDISYYAMQGGDAIKVFFGSVVDAADRGVDIRIMLDGIFHNLRGSDRDIVYALKAHPAIELRFYEPFDFLRPWTWHNRLHDKFIIADQQLALIGGRNIGDKYFATDGYQGASNDRDVLIVKLDSDDGSAVDQMADYYQFLWNHEYTEPSIANLSRRQIRKAEDKLTALRSGLNEWKTQAPEWFDQAIDWQINSHPTDGVYFVHNPLERWNKDPLVWKELVKLTEQAETSVLIQSPYIIPTRAMKSYLDLDQIHADQIDMVTNSLAASPNIVAYSGYRNHRSRIAQSDINLYEYQGPHESVHTKSMVIDEWVSIVGSFNLDARSTFLNTESVVVINSEPLAEEIQQTLEQTILAESLFVDKDGEYLQEQAELAAPVSFLKKSVTFLLSIVVRLFEHLI